MIGGGEVGLLEKGAWRGECCFFARAALSLTLAAWSQSWYAQSLNAGFGKDRGMSATRREEAAMMEMSLPCREPMDWALRFRASATEMSLSPLEELRAQKWLRTRR